MILDFCDRSRAQKLWQHASNWKLFNIWFNNQPSHVFILPFLFLEDLTNLQCHETKINKLSMNLVKPLFIQSMPQYFLGRWRRISVIALDVDWFKTHDAKKPQQILLLGEILLPRSWTSHKLINTKEIWTCILCSPITYLDFMPLTMRNKKLIEFSLSPQYFLDWVLGLKIFYVNSCYHRIC
jgi:hypothetical protein